MERGNIVNEIHAIILSNKLESLDEVTASQKLNSLLSKKNIMASDHEIRQAWQKIESEWLNTNVRQPKDLNNITTCHSNIIWAYENLESVKKMAAIKDRLKEVPVVDFECLPKDHKEKGSILTYAINLAVENQIQLRQSRYADLITFLLNRGVNPNIPNDSDKTLLELIVDNTLGGWLIVDNSENSYVKIIDLLLAKGANPNIILKALAKRGLMDTWVNNKGQSASPEWTKKIKIWTILSKLAFEKKKGQLLPYYQKIFKSLLDKINNAKIKAKKDNKKLMILIGEAHGVEDGIESLLIQLMTYRISNKIFKIQNVLEEIDHKMLDSYNTHGYYHTRKTKWTTLIEFLNMIKANSSPTIIPIDINQSDYGFNDVDDKKDVAERNKTMIEQAIKVGSDVLCIVGAKHLPGLLEDEKLHEEFFVLPITTLAAEKKFSPVIYFPVLENPEDEMLFSPDILNYMDGLFSIWTDKAQIG